MLQIHQIMNSLVMLIQSLSKKRSSIYAVGICEECKSGMLQHGADGPFLSQAGCIREYGICIGDLKGLYYEQLTNPVRKQFPPLKLFRRDDIHAVVEKKFGSVEIAIER